MKFKSIDTTKALIISIISLLLWVGAAPARAACTGCLCPGDPCELCPLPAMEDTSPVPNEPDICVRIKEIVPAISHPPGTNEHFASLDRSTMVCMREGGDVIRNSRRNEEFPSRVYCKPPEVPAK